MNVPDAKQKSFSLTSEQNVWPMLRRLAALYDSGEVKRLHTVPTVRHHTIAEHVYGTLIIATELVELNRARVAKTALSLRYESIVRALLIHDAPEVETGDVPAPVKRKEPQLVEAYERLEEQFFNKLMMNVEQLNEAEADIAKAADTLDLGYKCLMERALGNRHASLSTVHYNIQSYAFEKNHVIGVNDIRSYLGREWDLLK